MTLGRSADFRRPVLPTVDLAESQGGTKAQPADRKRLEPRELLLTLSNCVVLEIPFETHLACSSLVCVICRVCLWMPTDPCIRVVCFHLLPASAHFLSNGQPSWFTWLPLSRRSSRASSAWRCFLILVQACLPASFLSPRKH